MMLRWLERFFYFWREAHGRCAFVGSVFYSVIGMGLVSLASLSASGQTFGVTYQGRILHSSGQPLEASSVRFVLSVLAGNRTCVVYSESFQRDMTGSLGVFNFVLGRGQRQDTNGLRFDQLFYPSQTFPPSSGCPEGHFQLPTERLSLVLHFDEGSGMQTAGAVEIQAVPYALEAINIAGVPSENVLRVQGSVNVAPMTAQEYLQIKLLASSGASSSLARLQLAPGESLAGKAPLKLTAGPLMTSPEPGAIEFDGNNLFYTTADGERETVGAVSAGLMALTGDVVATGAGSVAATVSSVGGSSAANIHAAERAVNVQASSSSSPSVLVKRDVNGNSHFKSISIDGSESGSLVHRVSSAVTPYSLTWPSSAPNHTNSVLAADSSGALSWVNLGAIAGTISLGSQVTGVLPIDRGGTNSNVSLNNNQLMVSKNGAITEFGTMGDGQILVGQNGALPQSLPLSGDAGLSNDGALTINKVKGIEVSGVGLASKNILQNVGSATIEPHSVLVANGTGTGVSALIPQVRGMLVTSASGIPEWAPLQNDTLTQYVLASGREGGQTLRGGTGPKDNLTLDSTANTSKGSIFLNPSGGGVGIGTTNIGTKSLIVTNGPTNNTDVALGEATSNATSFVTYGGGAGYFSIGRYSDQSARINNTGNLWGNQVVLGTTGNVGLGTAAPESKLHLENGQLKISSDATTSSIFAFSFGGNARASHFLGIKGGGTIASPTPPSNGDFMAIFEGRNHETFMSKHGSGMDVMASENHSDTAQGSHIVFRTVTKGTTDGTEKVRIDDAGNVGIGATAPKATLDVRGSFALNGLYQYILDGSSNTSTSFYHELLFQTGVGSGYVEVEAWLSHCGGGCHTAHRKAVLSLNGYADIQYSQDNSFNMNSGGLWNITRPSNAVLRLEHQKGSVNYGAAYKIMVRSSVPLAFGPYTESSAEVTTDTGQTYFPAKVGVGTRTPSTALHVASGSIASNSLAVASGATTIDWSLGNVQYTNNSCNVGAFTFNNLIDGGSYTFVVKGGTSSICTFGSTGLTYHFNPPNAATTASTHTVYTFFRAGDDVYVSWVSGL